MSLLGFGQPANGVVQVGIVVEDLDAAIDRYVTALGVGPWFVAEHFSPPTVEHRGRPTSLDVNVGLAFAGHMQIELVQENGDADRSLFADGGARKYGFHHWGVSTVDFDRDLTRLVDSGYACVMTHVSPYGNRGAFLEASAGVAGTLELIEMAPSVEAFFNEIYAASIGWDGSEPVRRVSAVDEEGEGER